MLCTCNKHFTKCHLGFLNLAPVLSIRSVPSYFVSILFFFLILITQNLIIRSVRWTLKLEPLSLYAWQTFTENRAFARRHTGWQGTKTKATTSPLPRSLVFSSKAKWVQWLCTATVFWKQTNLRAHSMCLYTVKFSNFSVHVCIVWQMHNLCNDYHRNEEDLEESIPSSPNSLWSSWLPQYTVPSNTWYDLCPYSSTFLRMSYSVKS